MINNPFDITPEEYITCDFWKNLAGELGEPCYFKHTDEAHTFLGSRTTPAVLLTGWSDTGIEEQKEKHPNKDIFKMLMAADWASINNRMDSYLSFQVRPPAGPYCHATDRYIAKMERTSYWTFNDVPAHIRWYTANLNVNHPRIGFLPFGIIAESDCSESERSEKPTERLARFAQKYRARPKKNALYVNFQPHTLERLQLRDYYKGRPWVTYRENVPIEQFLEEVAEHEFVLCPPGNGMDCYRTLEAIYLGSIPILPVCYLADHYRKLNVPIVSTGLFGITEALLKSLSTSARIRIPNYDKVTKSYWKEFFGRLTQAIKEPTNG